MKIDLAPWQMAALVRPHEHFAMFGGIATGKTYTGSHFVVQMVEDHPDKTGLIGANNYDQLSTATLRELFYWLDEYKYDYVIDQRPPVSWPGRRQFKTYKNILCIRAKSAKMTVNILTRVMSAPNPLRGVEFSWYWLDESRDTPQNTHDVVLSRMRESFTFRRGLITTTTAGEDWAYQRFVKGARVGQRLYGSMHVPTIRSVEAGIISPEFYSTLRQTYSPQLALQELDAQHVNVRSGRAYYSASEENRKRISPWGESVPNKNRPLIIGCDFNYSPAPCVWMVGQVGPNLADNYGGLWSDHIHWYGEIAQSEISTRQMTKMLVARFPGFFYRIFGDTSGNRGTTSNAGQHDYAQVNDELTQARASFMIDVEQSNPHVKDRVENMNRMFKNAIDQVHMTYDPIACPLFDSDAKQVGWKQTIQIGGRAKLDDGGNKQLTHATDGGGYAVWKVFPYGRRGTIGINISSVNMASMRSAF